MKLIVFGGAGYIGSHFVKSAIEQNHEVVVYDNLRTGHLEAVDPKAVFIHGDLLDKSKLEEVFQIHTFDAVIHFAAASLVGESVANPTLYFENNVSAFVNLLSAMTKHGIKKIVFSSSAAVYGAHQEMPITEKYATLPTNPYGETKLMMEKMMKWADGASGIKYVSLRYFNVAGASLDQSLGEDHRPETHLIPIVLQVPLGKRPYVTIFGNDYNTLDGTCIRDYIHIEDLVDAHLRALRYLDGNNSSIALNLGTSSGTSNLEIVEIARKVTKHPIPIKIGERRPGDPDKLVASYDLAFRVLGWKPSKSMEDIISSAWKFHQKHPEGFGGKHD